MVLVNIFEVLVWGCSSRAPEYTSWYLRDNIESRDAFCSFLLGETLNTEPLVWCFQQIA